jgi:hypothetical protein
MDSFRKRHEALTFIRKALLDGLLNLPPFCLNPKGNRVNKVHIVDYIQGDEVPEGIIFVFLHFA